VVVAAKMVAEKRNLTAKVDSIASDASTVVKMDTYQKTVLSLLGTLRATYANRKDTKAATALANKAPG